MSCGVGHRLGSDLALLCGCGVGWKLQLRCHPLAWEPPYAASAALKRQKTTRRKKRKKKRLETEVQLVSLLAKRWAFLGKFFLFENKCNGVELIYKIVSVSGVQLVGLSFVGLNLWSRQAPQEVCGEWGCWLPCLSVPMAESVTGRVWHQARGI